MTTFSQGKISKKNQLPKIDLLYLKWRGCTSARNSRSVFRDEFTTACKHPCAGSLHRQFGERPGDDPLPVTLFEKGVENFYLEVEKFYLEVENFCLEVENFYLEVEKFYLEVEKFCLEVEKFYLEVEKFYLEVEKFYMEVEKFYLEVEKSSTWK
jgi:hypothetical protein